MILGFGAIEERTALSIIEECAEVIKNTDKNHKKEIDKVQKKYSDLEKKYKTMDKNKVPERYSHFYYTYYEMYPGNCAVRITFHHINRQHPFSSDGWALLVTEWFLSVSNVYGTSIYKQA